MRGSTFLLIAWTVLFGLALLCLGVFAQGIIRDHRIGEPAMRIDLSAESDWQTQTFRLFGEGDYRLILSSVNHDSARVGRGFDGALDVEVRSPDGRHVYSGRLDSVAGYKVPDDYGDKTLQRLNLSDWPLRAWELRARVAAGDPDFQTSHSELKLWKERYDPGMGGLINYAMIVPAGVFLLLALIVALPIARRGKRLPLVTTGAALLIFLLVLP